MEAFAIEEIWQQVEAELLLEFGEGSSIARWLGMARVRGLDGDAVLIGVPNRFVLEWIEKKYLGDFERILSRKLARPMKVRLRIDPELFQSLRSFQEEVLPPGLRTRIGESGTAGGRDPGGPDGVRGPVPAGFQRATLDDFVVGESNRAAFAAIRSVVEVPGRRYNPLVIHGASGAGKSHLLLGVHAEFQARGGGLRSRFIEGEDFLNHFIASIREGTIGRFRERTRSLDVLVFDNLQLLCNKKKTQEEFFFTLDTLLNSGSQVIIGCAQHPRFLPALGEALLGRLISGLVVALERPDFDTRIEILRRQARRRALELDEDLIAFMAESLQGDARELIGALNQVEARARLLGAPPDHDSVRAAVEASFHTGRERVFIDRVAEAVSAFYRVPVAALRSKRRERSVSRARQVAIHLCRRYTDHSLAEIGAYFGNRNYSTVRSADKAARSLLEDDPALRKDIQEIAGRLRDGPAPR